MRTSRTRLLAPFIILSAIAGLSACVPDANDDDKSLDTLPSTAPIVTASTQVGFSTLPTTVPTTATTGVVITAGTATLPSVDPDSTEDDGTTAGANGGTTASTQAQGQATTTTAKKQVTTTTSATGPSDYTIVAGDYLGAIAKRCGIGPTELANYNNWSDGSAHAIFPGQKIKLPCVPSGSSGTTATTAPGATTTTAAGSSTATSTTVAAGPGGTYTVKAGDYLSGIAAKTGTTVDAIVAANGWTDGANHPIYPGQVIKMPAKAG